MYYFSHMKYFWFIDVNQNVFWAMVSIIWSFWNYLLDRNEGLQFWGPNIWWHFLRYAGKNVSSLFCPGYKFHIVHAPAPYGVHFSSTFIYWNRFFLGGAEFQKWQTLISLELLRWWVDTSLTYNRVIQNYFIQWFNGQSKY